MTETKTERSRAILKRFFVDDTENQKIKAQMTTAGIDNFSVYARLMLLHGEVKVVDFSALDKLRQEINRIGVNVNQIAKYANTNETISQEDLSQVFEELKTVEALVHQTVKAAEKGIISYGCD
ncbi:MAG: MobC family plasmid mobilization relaxosome protein [Streptococcus mutans]|uniref:MobC family plasmid mobilization relaxosome protein n=1 Tax=Streptococcus anginosus group TaxID=671232 RepID=UPI001C8B9263|nr:MULTISPECIES: MobC family plasmid mobilization relaxosome protein [Streptococcus anginosus group]MBX9101500.1 MobC family plasmid mobilization relaxosome protein [Streptococcus anginosus]MCI3917487.1 MobC family plasmid mobilization relaxosome protein [Streptococcus intermedius]MDX5014683.1 MobC family plasmid mobilization relaxosome protein [Streptococcus anginosus]MDX5018760.1 MobC family plasmid mobilization relaxosome protein [Streptococcus anginosus]